MSARGSTARDGESRRARRNQLVLFSVIAAAVLMVFAFWLAAGGSNAPRQETRIDAELATPGTAEESWTRRSEARLGAMDARLRDMEAEAKRVKRENESLRQQLAANVENAKSTIDSLAAKIGEMERARAGEAVAAADGTASGELFRRGAGQRRDAQSGHAASGAAPETESLIETFRLDGAGELFEAPAARDIGAWLPAGSHAEAIVLAGVDASAGVSSQGDPRPVLLRIVGPAWTAASDGTALAVDIDGCTVTGAAHGDLSSEKVYARLRTLTCTGDDPGTVVETTVAGFVAGAGKTGVRGPVVSREGALVEKAFLAGLVSGIGEGAASAFAPQAVATGTGAAVSGTSVANTGLGEIGRAGLGSGASSAGRKVADYLIRRAEQYQPVIQLQAGTRVTVVFIEGAWLDGRTEKTRVPAKGKRNG
ncbi:MAG: TraB/VirB10 family protein [Rhodospirillaceae bacterium]|nr:TraB/VirB10 family protein [Rhodospirillaceae bacterium]